MNLLYRIILPSFQLARHYTKINNNKPIRRIVVPHSATTLTLKKVKGQGHGMASLERASHKDHACQISMLYL